MLSVEIGSFITTVSFLYALVANRPALFYGLVAVWLWLTVMFANFAESVAEIKGKAKADELRRTRSNLMAKQLKEKRFGAPYEMVPAADLKKGDLVLVQTGETIPADGEIVDGAAVINESAVTGESAPVIREAGGDRCSVVAGTKVISNEIIVRVTVNQGEAFLDKLISMIETAKRPKTPNEIALETLLIALTAIFVFVCANFWSLSVYSVNAVGHGTPTDVVVLVALFVCLAPTTIAALLPAIGIAGMDRLFGKNVIALSGRAIEASGDIDTILLDKTGTITHGNRQAVSFIPVNGHTEKEVAEAAYIASLNDETPEGKSTVDLALKKYGVDKKVDVSDYKPILFSAQTRMSGADVYGHRYRKGAPDAIENYVLKNGGAVHPGTNDIVTEIARTGGTPLLASVDNDICGVIHLKDVLKEGIRERIARVQAMGIKTVLITGDNPLTAAHIAKEAGIDEYVGAGEAGGQAAHRQGEAGGRHHGRHDGRRHQRRAGAGPGGRGRGHERGHAGRPRGGQHGRPGQRPGEADRHRAHRQGDPDDPGRADDLQHRQRRRQVLRHHPGRPVHRVPPAGRPGLPGAPLAGERDPVGGDLQRHHHRPADTAGAPGGEVPAHYGGPDVRAEPAPLRRRRRHRTVHRHQADRPAHRSIHLGREEA